MARTTITQGVGGHVTLAYDGEDYHGRPARIERLFTCPWDGGYVHEIHEDGSTTQPCGGLAGTGSTLMCGGRDGRLLGLIRREWRRGRIAAAREMASYG